ncbi:MAG: hypothetical protein Q4D07_09510 [Selenomonadaceae bacterium]|nr:hypothetical protein [Selenomonadaceae bacterium]
MRKFSWKKVNVEVPVPIPGAVRLRQSQAFKLAAALAVGVVAALIIMMTGFGAEYKTATVMYRAFVGFLFGSFSVFILEQLLDRIGIPMFVARNAEMQSVWVSEAYDDDYLYALDEGEEISEEAAEAEETGEEAGGEGSEENASGDTDAAVDQLLADVAAEESGEKAEPEFVPFFAEEEPAEFNAFTAENLPKAE